MLSINMHVLVNMHVSVNMHVKKIICSTEVVTQWKDKKYIYLSY